MYYYKKNLYDAINGQTKKRESYRSVVDIGWCLLLHIQLLMFLSSLVTTSFVVFFLLSSVEISQNLCQVTSGLL